MTQSLAETPAVASEAPMPRVPFGPHTISRLVLGSNPLSGGSHLSRFVNERMKRYFTPERILALLAQCEAEGVTAWQSGEGHLPLYERHRGQGGRLQFLSLAQPGGKAPSNLERLAAAGAIAVAHHGEHTDRLFKSGRIEEAREYLKRVRDLGLLVGVSTHMPSVVDYVESKGWDVDFFMACVYERTRTREEWKALLGHVPIPEREVYLEDDPPRMFQAMRQTAKPCLAFKILAAGRLCENPQSVEKAFESTFRQIKPADAVIVGLYPDRLKAGLPTPVFGRACAKESDRSSHRSAIKEGET
ncbi:MAG: hypothetical protein NTW86_08460 [Candidatus Sumerlaeota bacterium]|nr:hypothetical protein [Candidatus Sumerlaeota bacterium]